MVSVDGLASMIDHSIIDPNHTEDDMRAGIELACRYRTGRFTTQPFRVRAAGKLLDGTGIALQTYIGFPHGNDVTAVKVLQAKTALDDGVTVKAILECYFLNREQKRAAALAAEEAGVAFIKTSTGTRPDKQASIAADVRLFRSILKPETVIKASGGVFDLDAVLLYYESGARRFGASETAVILEDMRTRLDAGLLAV